jgi:hypothetical protein
MAFERNLSVGVRGFKCIKIFFFLFLSKKNKGAAKAA